MSSSFLLAALTAACCLVAAAAGAETFVVVESSAADVKVGAEIADGASITVPDGARVVLVGSSGQVVAFAGPFQGLPKSSGSGAPQNRVLDAVASLVATSGTTVGVSRAAGSTWRSGATKTADDVFAVDAGEGGDTCLYDSSTARVIRDPSAGSGEATITAMEGSAKAAVAWSGSMAYAPWPKEIPLADQASYLIEQAGRDAAAVATLHLLQDDPAMTGIQRVVQLKESGCDAQARLLLAIVARDSR
jgi:hypothetical protein